MNWKFWQKQGEAQAPGSSHEKRPSKPKAIPEPVGRYLVVNLHEDPDWVWNLRAVERQREQETHAYDIRVFDASKVSAQGVRITDYESFDAHPELVLFEGWFHKKTMKVSIEKKQGSGKMPKAA